MDVLLRHSCTAVSAAGILHLYDQICTAVSGIISATSPEGKTCSEIGLTETKGFSLATMKQVLLIIHTPGD